MCTKLPCKLEDQQTRAEEFPSHHARQLYPPDSPYFLSISIQEKPHIKHKSSYILYL